MRSATVLQSPVTKPDTINVVVRESAQATAYSTILTTGFLLGYPA